jgi:NAD(P)-dependent dehydrogenase (short-subunit alcohol dehydrogenase family)
MTAIVTGGGRGIGEEICRAAAARGHRVGVLDVDGDAAAAVAASLPGAVGLPAAVNDEDQVLDAFDRFTAAVGEVPDLVVNNAGIVRFGSLAELSAQDWRDTLEVNLTGTFLVGRTAATRMAAGGRGGAIVNLTSINGVTPGPYAGAYGSTKAAVALLTAQMAIEFGPDGVRVNSVAPGFVDGGMSEPLYADPATRRVRTAAVPLRRLGTPADIASVVLWLGSEDAGYVTGQNLVADGGVVGSVLANLPRPAAVDGVGDEGGSSGGR